MEDPRMSPNLQDRLHHLLLEAEQFAPGSAERTNSLEQIRMIIMDRSSSMRHLSPMMFPRQGSAGRSYQSGSYETHGLDDYYLGSEGAHLHSIPETGDHIADLSGRMWEPQSNIPFAGGLDDDIEGTFTMDDVGAVSQHRHSGMSTTAPGLLAGHQMAVPGTMGSRGMPTNGGDTGGGGRPAVGFSAMAGGGAAGVLSTGLGKPAAPAAASKPSGTRAAAAPKSPGQGMSSLAKEEQAAIPHVPSGRRDVGGPPVVPVQSEPDKRLSHKEVEQRRREKAKQYFDELRGLLPYGGESAKFDKNAILHHSILLIRQLLQDLDQEEAAMDMQGRNRGGHGTTPADFRCCFDVSRQPLCFAALDSRLWEANTAFCTLMGYTRMEVLGMSLLSATAPENADSSARLWQQMADGREVSTTYCCKLIRKDAQQVVCNVDLNLVTRNGKPYCFLVAANPTL